MYFTLIGLKKKKQTRGEVKKLELFEKRRQTHTDEFGGCR